MFDTKLQIKHERSRFFCVLMPIVVFKVVINCSVSGF